MLAICKFHKKKHRVAIFDIYEEYRKYLKHYEHLNHERRWRENFEKKVYANEDNIYIDFKLLNEIKDPNLNNVPMDALISSDHAP